MTELLGHLNTVTSLLEESPPLGGLLHTLLQQQLIIFLQVSSAVAQRWKEANLI